MDLHPSKRRKLNGLVLDDSQRGSDTSTSTSSSAERPASQSINRNPSKSDQSCGPSPAFQYGARRGQTIYQQSTFSELQIRELLNGLRPKHEQRMVRVEKVMQRLKNIIDGIPRREGLPVRYYPLACIPNFSSNKTTVSRLMRPKESSNNRVMSAYLLLFPTQEQHRIPY